MSAKHHFTLTVETDRDRKSAEMAVLAAFALRDPDGCKFYLVGKDKPKPQKVPLGPEDVPPLSVFRHSEWDNGWRMPHETGDDGVSWGFCNACPTTSWDDLMRLGWEIKRPTDTDWKGCWKEVEL